MKQNKLLLLVGVVVALLFVLLQVFFIVREGEVAVVTTFGRPVRPLTEAGLYLRWPWPIQKVYRYDNRTHVLAGPFEETLTQDNKNIIVAVYAGWRIQEPISFLERVGTFEQAQNNLDGLVRNYKNAILGQFPLASLVNVQPQAIKFDQIEAQMQAAVQPEARARYGIEVTFLGIRKLGLPEQNTEKVFGRMREERNIIAARYRSEGDAEATKIRAQADSQRDQILAKAEADAKRVRAEGDAQAAQYYQVFDKNPDLALFLRKLEVLEQTLKEKSTVVLGADTEPYDLLRGGAAIPGGGTK